MPRRPWWTRLRPTLAIASRRKDQGRVRGFWANKSKKANCQVAHWDRKVKDSPQCGHSSTILDRRIVWWYQPWIPDIAWRVWVQDRRVWNKAGEFLAIYSARLLWQRPKHDRSGWASRWCQSYTTLSKENQGGVPQRPKPNTALNRCFREGCLFNRCQATRKRQRTKAFRHLLVGKFHKSLVIHFLPRRAKARRRRDSSSRIIQEARVRIGSSRQ